MATLAASVAEKRWFKGQTHLSTTPSLCLCTRVRLANRRCRRRQLAAKARYLDPEGRCTTGRICLCRLGRAHRCACVGDL